MRKPWGDMGHAVTRTLLSAAVLAAVGGLSMVVAGCGSSNGTTPAPAAQGLWVPNYGTTPGSSTVVEFVAKQLGTSGSPAPELTNSSASIQHPFTVVFDNSGNQWVVNNATGTVTEFSQSQLQNLSTTPAPTPAVTLTSSSFGFIVGGVFDASGDLWVGNATNPGALSEFTPAQLKAGGSQTPNITLTSTDLINAQELRFAIDGSGNLWIGNGGGGNVLEFTKSQLAAGGSQTANIVLSGVNTTFTRPRGLAFTSAGDLWVTDDANNTLLKFNAGDIKVSGDPTPAVVLSATTVTGATGPTSSLDGPAGIAFDTSGNLWISNINSDTHGSLARFNASQLSATGSPAPAVFIDDDGTGKILNSPEFIIFGPAISN